ncbi:glycoside hydrolase family 2 protein [Methylobacterium organophilum]|uniref:Beta-mannosidase-like galactose-binding domain-containing protein n=1 Tax=Methylobacterium organophilum TaxID=410 RepID=A0ABQ4TAM7_METOR|nr:glycoside hydrolase family 2 protein [Methylobacterium organophilum]GJE28064.1 hypothetical protein LKMONMHP_2928 [Methylobacterium organophilum]
MARVLSVDGRAPEPLSGPWELLLTAPEACPGPGDLAGREGWIPALVPGTAAAALKAAGLWSAAAPTPLHESDIWYRTRFAGSGRACLRFEGLATLAEVWLNGVLVLSSRSMFLAHAVEVDLAGDNTLAIRFRALSVELAKPHKRGRWRPRLATPGSLRHVRTSLLGFMPGWCPSVDAVGPYRPVTLEALSDRGPRVLSADLRSDLDGETGRLSLRLAVANASGPALLRCAGHAAPLRAVAPGLYEADLALPGVAAWWPHTHGEPVLHAVEAEIGGVRIDLGRTGFRRLVIDRTGDGFALRINGVPVFCRGACWTPPDLVGLSGTEAAYRPVLDLVRAAGMNMLRVGGTMLYEAAAFHDLCDALGILVWQDLMLANFDYPTDDPAFRDQLTREVVQLLDRTQMSPSLCVVGGGSEVWQQAAMLGFPREAWSGGFVEESLPGLVAASRPDLASVPNSPSGGDVPFAAEAGVAHYYGVGAYLRPLEDARRAGVRFATECLAFAHVPEPASLARAGLTDPEDPRWAAGVPRDRGADWDFEGVRDHYVGLLFGADPGRLRREAPERYLALGRAAAVEVIEATFAEWRRAASPTAGGLVWLLKDLAPGAGWGAIDHEGAPKAAWYALRRAFSPVQICLTDEGLNGLHVHVHNETPRPRDLVLRLAFTDAKGKAVAAAERALTVAPRSGQRFTSAALLGRFFDVTDAYRFGAPAHALGHAELCDAATGAVLAEAFHHPLGRDVAPGETGLSARLIRDGAGWALEIAAGRHAFGVAIDLDGATAASRPEDNHFHLAPGRTRTIPLLGRPETAPRGRVVALNALETCSFGGEDA